MRRWESRSRPPTHSRLQRFLRRSRARENRNLGLAVTVMVVSDGVRLRNAAIKSARRPVPAHRSQPSITSRERHVRLVYASRRSATTGEAGEGDRRALLAVEYDVMKGGAPDEADATRQAGRSGNGQGNVDYRVDAAPSETSTTLRRFRRRERRVPAYLIGTPWPLPPRDRSRPDAHGHAGAPVGRRVVSPC